MSEKVADCNDINRADRIRILEQCDDLECLLLNVVQTEKLLREDVQDALIKDIEEGILSQELTSKVIDEEQHLCNRSDYMQFCIGKRGAHGDIQNRKLKLCSWENAIQNALWNFSAIPDILIPLSPLMQSHFVGKKEYLEEDVRLYFEDFFTPMANTEMKTRPSFHVFINGTLIIAAPDPGDKQSRLRFSNEINSLENILTTEMCNKFSQVQSAQDLYTYLSNNEIVSELFHRELNRFSGRSCVITLVRVQDLNEIPKLTPKFYSQLLRGYIMNGRLCGIEQAFAHVYDEVLVCEENQNSSFAQEIQREAFNFCKTFVKQIHTQALENAKQDACEASGPVVNGEVDGLEKSICDQISSLSIVVLFFYTNNARKEEATDLNSNRVAISLFHAELIEPNLHESHFFSWSDLAGARQVSLHQSHRYAELDDSNTSTSTTSNVQTFKCKDALPPFRFCPNVEQSRVISPCNVLCRFLLQYIMKPQVRNHTYVSDWKMRYCCIAIAIGIFVFKQAYSKTK